jgi:proline iminopeptidase
LRESELQFFYQHGTSDIYPEAYEEYASFIPEEERHDLMTAYLKRLTSDDEALSLEAARRWSTWEESTNRLIQDPEGIHQAQTDDKWSRSVLSSITKWADDVGHSLGLRTITLSTRDSSPRMDI